jgi:hypothetical protein
MAEMDRGRHARLQRKHALLLRLAHDLSVENTQLRRKEKIMISLLAEQVIGIQSVLILKLDRQQQTLLKPRRRAQCL